MKTLLAVDGSDCSDNALKFTAQLPWKAGSEICLFTAVYLWEDDFYVFKKSYDAATEKAKQKALELLEEKREYLQKKLPQVTILIDYILDKPKEAIVEKAFAYKADLIIMGSHGRTAFKKVLMGSVADYVSRVAPCSVQVVKRPQEKKSNVA